MNRDGLVYRDDAWGAKDRAVLPVIILPDVDLVYAGEDTTDAEAIWDIWNIEQK